MGILQFYRVTNISYMQVLIMNEIAQRPRKWNYRPVRCNPTKPVRWDFSEVLEKYFILKPPLSQRLSGCEFSVMLTVYQAARMSIN